VLSAVLVESRPPEAEPELAPQAAVELEAA
jgi:hypothetical protein